MQYKVHISLPFNLIQEVRLAHAIAESDFKVSVPSKDVYKFSILAKKFNLEIGAIDSSGFDISGFLDISHGAPRTSIGTLRRDLIFPRSIADHCYSLWGNNRDTKFLFVGLMTKDRSSFFYKWLQEHYNTLCGKYFRITSLVNGALHKFSSLWRPCSSEPRRMLIGDLVLCPSARGRAWPQKAWDEEYYDLLADSHFVICPSGNFVWSYSFFEAILCGAIPDSDKTFVYSREDVEYNYSLCLEMLTLNKNVLNRILREIV